LEIDTDLLLIVTTVADDLSGGMHFVDFEPP